MGETCVDDGQGGFRGEESGKFLAKLRVAAQFAAQQDAIAGEALDDGPVWAGPGALAAGQASLPVELWPDLWPGKGDGLFLTGGEAGPAFRTGGLAYSGEGCADQADIDNLGAGAGIGTIGHGYPELVV